MLPLGNILYICATRAGLDDDSTASRDAQGDS